MNSKQQITLVDKFLDAVKNQEIHIVRECIAKNVAFNPDWVLKFVSVKKKEIDWNFEKNNCFSDI
jgi:hypothetical protein